MNFEPQKFFIGLMDFFSILLPGAALTYFLIQMCPVETEKAIIQFATAQDWAKFLFASYLFGHLVFLLSSWLDELYDWVRDHTLNKQIARVVRRDRVLPCIFRLLIWLVFKRESDLAVKRVVKIKERALGPLQAENSINAFQWSKALLTLESPESLAVVQRFEADSKFFRSFVVVLFVLGVMWPFHSSRPVVGSSVVAGLFLLALWRYMEQRFKATNQAYWSVIALTAKAGKVTFDRTSPSAQDPTHAGGVVFRKRCGKVRYLLVEAKDNPTEWVLPKGHHEESEAYPQTAVREVLEETGAWARVAAELGNKTFYVEGAALNVKFYLMQALGTGSRKDRDRRSGWFSYDEAREKATHIETKELLVDAENKRRELLPPESCWRRLWNSARRLARC